MKALRTNAGKKLRSRSGETIGETLVSLLIGALALTMLAGAVSTAGKLVNESRVKLNTYYSQRDVLTNRTSGTSDDNDTIIVSGGTVHQENKVILYSSTGQFGDTTIAAYKLR